MPTVLAVVSLPYVSQTLGKEAKAQQDEASLLAALQTHISMQWLTEEHPAVIQARSIGALSFYCWMDGHG